MAQFLISLVFSNFLIYHSVINCYYANKNRQLNKQESYGPKVIHILYIPIFHTTENVSCWCIANCFYQWYYPEQKAVVGLLSHPCPKNWVDSLKSKNIFLSSIHIALLCRDITSALYHFTKELMIHFISDLDFFFIHSFVITTKDNFS